MLFILAHMIYICLLLRPTHNAKKRLLRPWNQGQEGSGKAPLTFYFRIPECINVLMGAAKPRFGLGQNWSSGFIACRRGALRRPAKGQRKKGRTAAGIGPNILIRSKSKSGETLSGIWDKKNGHRSNARWNKGNLIFSKGFSKVGNGKLTKLGAS